MNPFHLATQSLRNQDDVKHVNFTQNHLLMEIYYVKGAFDIDYFNDYFLKDINEDNANYLHQTFPGVFSQLDVSTSQKVNYYLSNGHLLLIINDLIAYTVYLSKIPKRSPTTSQLDPINLLASQDGFIENANENITLIRKRLKTEQLVIKKYVAGSITQTDIYLLYLQRVENADFIKITQQKLEQLHDESIVSVNDLNKEFQGNSLLPLVFNTGSPEHAVGCLLDNRCVIILDNSPVVCVLPTNLSLFTTTKNEVNAPRYSTIFNRLFIFSFFFIAIFMLGVFISLLNFHPSFLSTILIANIQLTERGTTFPLFVEIIIVLFLFEFYRFATSRSPSNFVQNIVIIFGGLFIGQNAINSGIVGSVVLMLASLSYIAGFAITNNPHLITSLSLFRLFVLVSSYTLGLFGLVLSSIITINYFYTQKSVGQDYLKPIIPFNFKRLKDYLIPTRKGGIKKC